MLALKWLKTLKELMQIEVVLAPSELGRLQKKYQCNRSTTKK